MERLITLVSDTFVVKDGDSHIIYSPFSGIIGRVDMYPEKDSPVFLALKEKGFFGQIPETTKRSVLDSWSGFHSLTLLLTRRCNLSCSYCSACAKPKGDSMSGALALHSLEWFVRQLRDDTIRVSFHAGGEPTLESGLIRTVAGRTKEICGDKKIRFQIVTNGTADVSLMDWLMAEKFGISISMDGPPDIQNRNRPLVVGGGSSEIVERNVRHLVARNYRFTVRLTFSPVDDIARIIGYFGDLGVRSLHLEPLFPYGREYKTVSFGKFGEHQGVYSPDGDELLVSFLKALDVAKKYGIRIKNGHLGHFTKGVGYFCGSASGRSMVITHDGFLSGCLEVVDAKDKDFKEFCLGRYIAQDRNFEINKNVLEKMLNRHADVLPQCKTCYARYACAGGCAVKAMRESGRFCGRDSSYCHFTKALIPILTKRIAAASNV